MVANVKDEAVIVGAYNTSFSKDSGVSELSLAAQAVRGAIEDAGLKPTDVDGFATFTMDTNDEIEVARAVGTGELTFWGRSHYGGGAATGSLHQAVMAVSTGMAECVAVFRALNGRSGHRFSSGVSGEITTADAIHWGWYMPYGLLTPASWVAMFNQRWISTLPSSQASHHHLLSAPRGEAIRVGTSSLSSPGACACSSRAGMNLSTRNRWLPISSLASLVKVARVSKK